MNIDINLSVDFLLILFVLIVFEITSHYVDLGALGFELYYVEKVASNLQVLPSLPKY